MSDKELIKPYQDGLQETAEQSPIPIVLPRDGFTGTILSFVINLGLPEIAMRMDIKHLYEIAHVEDLHNKPLAIAFSALREELDILRRDAGDSVELQEEFHNFPDGSGDYSHNTYTKTQNPSQRTVTLGFYSNTTSEGSSGEILEFTTLQRGKDGTEQIVAQAIVREVSIDLDDPLKRTMYELYYATWLDGNEKAMLPRVRFEEAIQKWLKRDSSQDENSYGITDSPGNIRPIHLDEYKGF